MDDADGFDAFCRANFERVQRAVQVSLRQPELARDATAEAFTRAAERWSSVRVHPAPTGWVYRTAINWGTSWLRKMSLRPTRPLDALDRAHHDQHGLHEFEMAVSRLAMEEQRLLTLAYVLDVPIHDIAKLLGMPAGTVSSRLSRARKKLAGNAGDHTELRGTS